MNCFLDKDQELVFDQEKIVESCLKQLVELATQDDREFKPIEELKFKKLPDLPPITTKEVEEL